MPLPQTAPTLTAVQENDRETYQQLHDAMDIRLAEIEVDRKRGRLTDAGARCATATAKGFMEKASDAFKAITGCPLGIWLD